MFLELNDCSVAEIHESIQNSFENSNIPKSNFIRCSCNNTHVISVKGGNKQLLKQENSDLFIQPGLCHLLHPCVSKACTILPSYVVELERDIFSH